MDDITDDLVRVARRCDRVHRPFLSGNVKNLYERLQDAIMEVGLSWSGSSIGYHATVYLEGFRKPRPGEVFDREWGGSGIGGHLDRTRGKWAIVEYEDVKNALMSQASVSDLTPIGDAAKAAYDVFEQAKGELLPTLDAVLSTHDDSVLRDLRGKLAKLPSHFSMENLARGELPKGNSFTRDSLAASEGLRVPHHLVFRAWLLEQVSYGNQAGEVAKIARHAARYLEQRFKMKGKSIAKIDGKIFIGHGRSGDWNMLKDFLRDRLDLDYDEFNRDSPAGLTGKERLEQMLDNACFAFLVMTAEDEHADGSRHARENVIHEIGLFQGRLGFSRAIVLLEEGCQEFSNLQGIQQIRFRKGELNAKRDEIRQVLEREGIK